MQTRSLRDSAPALEAHVDVGVSHVFATMALAACVLFLTGSVFRGSAATLVTAAVLILISVPVLVRQASKTGSAGLLWLLLAALLLKLLGAVARDYVAFGVYGGVADAAGYHDWGVSLAARFREGHFSTGFDTLIGTNFIRYLTGIVYAIVGPTRLAGYMVFSWLGFWGLFFFYRAFEVAVPEGRLPTYGRLLFFLPSVIFWPSAIGKEAWMVFSLGLAAFGAARVLTGKSWRGLAVAGLGIWLGALVRPHVAGLVAVALAVSYLLYRPRKDLGAVGPILKLVSLAALVGLSVLLILRTESFLERSGINTEGGVSSVQGDVSDRTNDGGSRFAPSIVRSPARLPLAFFTVLFRPLLFEVHNTQSFIAASEATFLLVLSIWRFRWILAALRSIRRQPYLAFALMYTGLFIVAFSGVANFGLLARERVQLLPLYVVLLSTGLMVSKTKEADKAPNTRRS